jgi:type I restriction-modification system DNA methylase subunit/restriction endonuclease S subunit
MPTYTCEKCARVFKQKSGYKDHMEKKIDCSTTTIINEVIETKVEKKINEKVRSLTPYPVLDLSGNEDHDKPILQSFFEDLHNLLWNRAGLNPEKALDHLTFFFAYRLIEIQADLLNLPQECRWSYVASLKNENDLFEIIKKGVSSFRAKPKTKPFFKPHEIQKADIVSEIVNQINRIPLKALQETDTLGNIFEYMLGRGMSTMSDEGQYFTNRTICKLAFKLSYDIKKTLRRSDGTLCTFADWFCGTGGFPAAYVKGVRDTLGEAVNWKKDSAQIYCQDMNLSSVTTSLLNLLILTGYPFSSDTIRSANSFTDSITMGDSAPFKDLTIDYCFMNPPYGGDKSKGKEYKFAYAKKIKDEAGKTTTKFMVNADIQSIGIQDDDKVSAGVQLSMATLSSDGGICAIVLPQGFFFGASKKCVELRKKIAEEYKIHYVVDIASGSFLNTGTKTSMMIFQKGVGPTQSVKFIGLDEKLLVDATLADLRSKSYSLNYKQYLPQSAVEVEGFEMVKLGELVEADSGDLLPKDKFVNGDYSIIGGGKIIGTYNKSNRNADEIVISRVGNACITYMNKKYYLTDNALAIVSKNQTKMLTKYLYYYLTQNIDKLREQYSGTAQPVISKTRLYDIQIPLPSLERQQEIVQAIDIWTNLAQQEESTLKMLEQQMMFEVKEMGRGKPRVKLGEVCDIRYGDKNPSYETKELYPGIGGGVSPSSYVPRWNIEAYTPIVSRSGSAGHISRYHTRGSAGSFAFVCLTNIKIIKDYLYFALKNDEEYIKTLPEGTVQKNMNRDVLRSIEISLPTLAEQQTLQPHFDEIRHKHAKIAEYKAKAQEAIGKFIPTSTTV